MGHPSVLHGRGHPRLHKQVKGGGQECPPHTSVFPTRRPWSLRAEMHRSFVGILRVAKDPLPQDDKELKVGTRFPIWHWPRRHCDG
jgi:hypothetical protein